MIELKAKSENYIPKEELEKILNKIEAEDMVCVYDEDLKELLGKDFDVEIELEQTDILNELWAQEEATETLDYSLDNAENDAIAEYLCEQGFIVKESETPLLASNFNAYDFKRKMCDLFETGYHVDSFDLVKMFAEKLRVDYLL